MTERKRQDQALRDSEGHLRTLNEQLEKRVEEEIGRREAALAALHQSQKLDALGQLTAGIAHDFNNLVAAMAGGFSLVQRWTRNDERVQEVARQGLIAAGRGADLVKHLLAFARKQHLAPRRVNLADLLEEAEPLLRQSTGSRISVRIACPEVCPDVEVDVAQLETALMNLAINARDAMPDGGVLDITVAEPEPGIAAIVVRDRGGGMPADVLDRAREPFFTTKQPGKGTGLGLAMVHGFAEQSGGSLRITSEPGEGTTVELRLPSSGPAEAALAPATAEAARDSAAIRRLGVPLGVPGTIGALLDGLLPDMSERKRAKRALEAAADGWTELTLKTSGQDPLETLWTSARLPDGSAAWFLADAAQAGVERRRHRLVDQSWCADVVFSHASAERLEGPGIGRASCRERV